MTRMGRRSRRNRLPVAARRESVLLAESRGGSQTRAVVLAVSGLLLLAVVLAFGQTLSHDFVNYDDDLYVSKNPPIARGFSADGIAWALTTTRGSLWAPLTWLSYMLDALLFGPSPWGFHLSNFLLHAITAILLFRVLWWMTTNLWISALVAAIFAVHPLQVESTAWVAERKGVLSGLLFMLTLVAYLHHVRRPFSITRYVMVVALFGLGLMAKPMLVTLPFVLLLLDYWPLGRTTATTGSQAPAWEPTGRVPKLELGNEYHAPAWRLVIEKLPLLLLTSASCLVTPLSQGAAVTGLERLPLAPRIANAVVSYDVYLSQFFYPVGLAVPYPHRGASLPLGKVILALLVLVAISFGAAAGWRRNRALAVGWLWYVGMLVPVIGLVQLGAHAMADRYMYLPMIGLCLAVGCGAAYVIRSWFDRHALCGIASALLLAALTGCAWRQSAHWHDSETLWVHTLSCTSQNCVGHNNLGNALAGQGRDDEAIAEYQEALKINRDYAAAHFNLGNLLAKQGRLAAAVGCYEEALKIRPNFAEARNGLGAALAASGRFGEASIEYERALELDPDYAEAHNNLGVVLAHRGRLADAVAHYEKALGINPRYAEAHNNLGDVLARLGRIDAAVERYLQALEINPRLPEAHNNLGNALAGRGLAAEAIAEYLKAIELRPDFAEAHNNLGAALAGRGHIDEAIVEYRKALQIKPDYADARENLNLALSERERRSRLKP